MSDTCKALGDTVMSKTGMVPWSVSLQYGGEVILTVVMLIIVTQRATKVNRGCSDSVYNRVT